MKAAMQRITNGKDDDYKMADNVTTERRANKFN